MRAAIAMLMACTLMFAPASTLAEEHAEDEPYEVTVADDRAEIQIPHGIEGADEAAETTIVFDTREGLVSGELALAQAEAGPENLEIRLHQLVEYVDEDEDGMLSEEDEIASAWQLANGSKNMTAESNGTLEWRSLSQQNVTSEEGVEGTLVQGVAEFPSEDPIEGVLKELGQAENRTLTVNLTVFEEPTSFEDTEVGASQVHVAWTLDRYPYTHEDSELALVTTPNASSELTLEEREDAHRLASQGVVEGYDAQLAADVAEQAHVDGDASDASVGMLDLEDEDEEVRSLLTLSYERGQTIEHELVLGSSVAPVGSSTIDAASDRVSEVPAPGALAALGLMGLVALAVRKR